MTRLTVDQSIHDQVDALRKAADANVPPEVRQYYAGDQPPVATPDQMAALGDRATKPYVENILKQCVDTIAGRLLFRQYLCEDGDTEKTWLDAFARKNRIGAHLNANTVRCLVDGNNAMSLSWLADPREGERVVVHQEPWWDGKEGMYVESTDSGIEEWAVKEWTDLQERHRRTVYLPDQIQRYIRDGDGWQPLNDENGSNVIPWTKPNGDPLGVPVIHFAYTITADSIYGTSKIASLLGLQDALNGTIFDIVAAQALNAFGIFTATGVDDTSDLSVGPGRLWKTAGENAKFGVLNGANMAPILDGYRAIRGSIAGQFPVSEHLITGGQWPSGMALQRADGPMISGVKLIGETFAPPMVRLAHRAMEITNAFGGENLDENRMIEIEYAPAEQLDDATIVEIDREKVGMYRDLSTLPKVLMTKTGLVDDDEADAIIAERQSEYSMVADMATNEPGGAA